MVGCYGLIRIPAFHHVIARVLRANGVLNRDLSSGKGLGSYSAAVGSETPFHLTLFYFP